jgi:hypothetical protein
MTIVSTSAAITTRGRKRAATMPAGSTIQASTGLRGPPLSAIPAPMISIVITIAIALTRSGLALFAIVRSTCQKLSADSANRISVHQPIHGAEITSAIPIAIEPTRRIVRTRSLASTTRLRSSSVGHSHEAPDIGTFIGSRFVPI